MMTQSEVCFSDNRCSITVRRLKTDVLLAVYRGYLTAATFQRAIDHLQSLIEGGLTYDLFTDAWEAQGYEPRVRAIGTAWLKGAKGKVRSPNHVLLRSKILVMGLTLANMVLGDAMKPHSDRATFERALQASLGKR